MGRIEHTLLDEGRESSPTDLRPSPPTPPYHTKLRMFLSTTEDRDTPRHGAELLRITLLRGWVNKVEIILGLLLPVDLDEQHPRFEQRRQDREGHAHHKPVQASQPSRQHGDARNYRGYRGDLTHRYTHHERHAQIGPHRLPSPQ